MSKLTVQQREAAVRARIAGKEGEGKRQAEVVGVDVEARTVELAFSSETEVQRWFGLEVLSHDADAVDLARLNDGGAVLDGHDWSKQRGVVERAWIDSDRKGRALVRFGKSAAAEELFQDIVDKIKRHVSVGYRITAIKLTEERENVDVYTVTRWEPYEISIVPIPADTAVGVGRSAGAEDIEADIPAMERIAPRAETSIVPPTRDANTNRGINFNMKTKYMRDASGNLVRAEVDDDDNIVKVLEVIERANDAVTAARATGLSAERSRVNAIEDMATKYGKNFEGAEDLARAAVRDGSTPEQFQSAMLDLMDKRAAKPLNEQLAGADIGMEDKDVRRYSILRVVRCLIDPTDTRARKDAAFEFEVSEAAREKQENKSERFVIPTDVLRRSVHGNVPNDFGVRAPLNTGKTTGVSTGGNLIATDLMSASFIDILRAKATVMRRSRVLAGLVGNVDIPRQLAGATGYWIGEDGSAPETNIELGQLSMSPKTVAAFAEITRKLLKQSSLDVEAMVRADLAIAQALTIDKAGFYGIGSSNQPRGILNYTGINAVVLDNDWPTHEELVDMETAIALDNVDVDSLSYTANASFRGHCKKTEAFAGTGRTLWEQGGTVNGYATEITNQVNAGDTVMADWSNFVVGMWGGLEMNVDPFSNSLSGRLRIITFQDVDFALRRTKAVCLGRKAP